MSCKIFTVPSHKWESWCWCCHRLHSPRRLTLLFPVIPFMDSILFFHPRTEFLQKQKKWSPWPCDKNWFWFALFVSRSLALARLLDTNRSVPAYFHSKVLFKIFLHKWFALAKKFVSVIKVSYRSLLFWLSIGDLIVDKLPLKSYIYYKLDIPTFRFQG